VDAADFQTLIVVNALPPFGGAQGLQLEPSARRAE
jgi:hypothetical protein